MNNSLLLNIDISRLNNGNGLVDITRLPKWHKACYVLCRTGKTARAKNFLILHAISTYAAQALPHVLWKQIQTMSWLGFSVTTLLATLPRLRPCPLILMLDKSPKYLEILNCLPSCQVEIWSLLMLSINSFKAFWQHSMAEEDLGKYSRMKHTTSYKRRRTCICRGSVLHTEIWPDRWRPKCLRNLWYKETILLLPAKNWLAKKLQDHIPALESHNSKSGTLIQERCWWRFTWWMQFRFWRWSYEVNESSKISPEIDFWDKLSLQWFLMWWSI